VAEMFNILSFVLMPLSGRKQYVSMLCAHHISITKAQQLILSSVQGTRRDNSDIVIPDYFPNFMPLIYWKLAKWRAKVDKEQPDSIIDIGSKG
jgi:hypothetical protein